MQRNIEFNLSQYLDLSYIVQARGKPGYTSNVHLGCERNSRFRITSYPCVRFPNQLILNYQLPSTRSRRAPIAILLALALFAARIAMLHVFSANPAPTPSASVNTVLSRSPGLDLTMGNSLLHNTEGENVLYADGHVEWQVRPTAAENRGTNSNTWLDNIYTVQTSNLASSGGVVSGVPYDDKDAIMLPAAK